MFEKVAKDGGNICFGWTFAYRVNPDFGGYIIATHHAVWRDSRNTLIDVTPFTDDLKHRPYSLEGCVFFLVDESAQPVEQSNYISPLPLKFFPVGDNQKLIEYVNQRAEQEQKACQEMYEGQVNYNQLTGYI